MEMKATSQIRQDENVPRSSNNKTIHSLLDHMDQNEMEGEEVLNKNLVQPILNN